jgi:phage shock protein B
MNTGTLAVLLVFGIPIIAIISEAIIRVLKILTDQKKSGGKMNADEVQIIQDLNKGFTRLEERVESLETIMLDRMKKD